MIAVLTDFGTQDAYVGVIKGVILSLNPDTPIVDLTHAIPRHAVRDGALLLVQSVPYFPAGTVFLAVVDPGVGSERRPIAAEAGGYQFVGPDNGLLSFTLHDLGGGRAVELTETAFRLSNVSHAFHGRDIFAPAAAWLSLGTPLEAMGNPVDDWVELPPPLCRREGNIVQGEIVYVDGFGNLETSIGRLHWLDDATLTLSSEPPERDGLTLVAGNVRVRLPKSSVPPLVGLNHTYSKVAEGTLLAMVSSARYLEISVNRGSAAAFTAAKTGDPVELILE